MNHEILTSGEFEKPFNLIDLDAIQAKYPVPNTGFVIDACREVVEDSLTEASKGEHQQITRLKNELFGDRASKVDHGIFAGTPPEILARGLFVATLHEAVPVSTDFEQFKWRLDTFFGDKILDGEIVGDVPVVSHNNLYRENWSRRYKFDRTCRRKFAVIQTARYCSIHQDQEEAAIDYFMSTLENVRTGQEIKLHWPLVTESEIEYARTCLREGRRIQPTPDRKVYDRLLERISAKVQWRRKETPKDWTSPSLKNLVSDLELLPVDRIPPGELSSVYKTITNPKFKPDKPILLIPPSLKATRNFLKSLVKSETDYKTLTGKLLARFEAFEGDELIVYSDAIKIANQLTPIFKKQNLEVEDLDASSIEDFPKAVDRILFVVQAENQAELEAAGQAGHFTLAADCIKRLAFKGVEGKLEQRILTIGDLMMRYSSLPARQRSYLIDQAIGKRVSEGSIDNIARQLGKGTLNTPRKPGWGMVS